ncbi:hypothetical protein, unlikely [Trypanosoma brucei gambiense DAL972]|uniref:Uncharacterized protein n=1 Tax=Trypanosoma brucei gambiense (strain MHOM/CI/86/DAL972) TaxID=679716 RepID=D0A5W1_TRYB9|nr:hypothetical protein, unlikely [Trypanosoma brucei gambiense DAL972]CBH17062.1 hypothetical protein, unlikely [Trypanosoma brucei gambiense DAL972]|eukprot:XP_011779326.1 hypothetical protein, unlikely [Trypanosoma brucei gambiense DAL972]
MGQLTQQHNALLLLFSPALFPRCFFVSLAKYRSHADLFAVFKAMASPLCAPLWRRVRCIQHNSFFFLRGSLLAASSCSTLISIFFSRVLPPLCGFYLCLCCCVLP